jgi:hypothetical protein
MHFANSAEKSSREKSRFCGFLMGEADQPDARAWKSHNLAIRKL